MSLMSAIPHSNNMPVSTARPERRADYTDRRSFYFTIDCDWVPGSQVGLQRLLDFCDRHNMKATIFFAGRFAEAYPEFVRDCRDRGHQLGTHGWAHGGLEQDEDFRSASYEQQREWIGRATDAVERAAGVRPVLFRAPNLWIGETTLRALEAEGYRYDSSIPARRFDMGFGRVHYLKYFWAPAAPYRLSRHDLAQPGDSGVIEMPPSSCLFPINLATLRTLGLPVLRAMIRWIQRRTGHLVFYCHPSEFVRASDQQFPMTMSKWNRRGMRPENLRLVENLVEHLHARGYLSRHIMDAAAQQLDLRQTAVLRANGFHTNHTYQEGRR
jgi:peptidoglycan-N-acetylglucosamine deacetylase